MRKTTRIVSLVLVLLMLVGMMPLALFAADAGNDGGAGEATAVHDGKPIALPKGTAVTAIGAAFPGGQERWDFSTSPEGKSGWTAGDDTTGGVGTYNYKWNGGQMVPYYLLYPEGDTNNSTVIWENGALRLWGRNMTNYYTYLRTKYFTDQQGKDFVFSVDVKLTTADSLSMKLAEAIVNVSGARQYITLASIKNGGSIVLGDNGETIGYLNSVRYTTVGFRADVANNRLYVYMNGVCTNADGYQFISDETLASYGEEYNTAEFDFGGIRAFYSTARVKRNNSIYVDNMTVYVKDTNAEEKLVYIGENDYADGFVEDGDNTYYVRNGMLVFNETIEIVDGNKKYQYQADANGVCTLVAVVTTFNPVKYLSYSHLPTGAGTFVYDEPEIAAVIYDRIALGNFNLVNIAAEGFSDGYKQVSFDMYVPQGTLESDKAGYGADVNVDIVLEQSETWYKIDVSSKGMGGLTNRKMSQGEFDTDEPVYEGVTANGTTGYAHQGPNRNAVELDAGYLGTDADGNLYIKLYKSYEENIINLSDYTVGWHTITLDYTCLGKINAIRFVTNGYGVDNSGKAWYTAENTTYEKANGDANYGVKFANFKLVYSETTSTVVPGWTEDGKYISDETFEPLTGIQYVDGAYYDFGEDGVSKGKVNGLCDFVSLVEGDGYWSETLTKREFVDGKLLIAKLEGWTMSMDGQLGVNYYLDLSVVPNSDTYVEFTVNGSTQTVKLSELATKDGFYIATVSIPAAEMTDSIKAVVKYDEETVLYTFVNYSGVGYASTILNGNNYTAAAKDAVKAMLNYAAAAQVYFNHNTSNLANKALDEADKTVNVTPEEVYEKIGYAKVGEVNGATYKSSQLGLEGEVMLYHNFKLEEGKTLEDYTITVDGGLEIDLEETIAFGNTLRVKTTGIKAANLDTNYTVTLTDSEGNSLSVTYNAVTYMYLVLNAYGDDAEQAELVSLIKALYNYNVKADAYNDSLNG